MSPLPTRRPHPARRARRIAGAAAAAGTLALTAAFQLRADTSTGGAANAAIAPDEIALDPTAAVSAEDSSTTVATAATAQPAQPSSSRSDTASHGS
jgi:hypothetical protein